MSKSAKLQPVAIVLGMLFLVLWAADACILRAAETQGRTQAKEVLSRLGVDRGICVLLDAAPGHLAVALAKQSRLIVYVQLPTAEAVSAARTRVDAAGLLGTRIYVEKGDWSRIHLADNLVDAVVVTPAAVAAARAYRDELLRVVNPLGKMLLDNEEIAKPFAEGIDEWSHPYHGPDNNPQSTDRVARAPYITQFLAEPMFSPFPAITVAAGGRLFKAFGHHATHANQNDVLNTLLCVNAYNGTILWKRPLREGFTIHRNTMIATQETLYLADDQSCKLIDARTGRLKSEIVIPAGISDGPVWKWMALEDGVLYALVGGKEVKAITRRSDNPTLGGWPGTVQERSYADYKDPKTSPGFGRTFAAINPDTGKILWSHGEKEYIDSRGVCMKNGRIYFYSPHKFLGCLEAKAGSVVWKTSDPDLMKAIRSPQRGKNRAFFAETSYTKCTEKFVFFARCVPPALIAVSAEDGKMLWRKGSNKAYLQQLVMREDALYATAWRGNGVKLEYGTGEELASFPTQWACARATGSVDSIIYRWSGGGTARLDVASGAVEHLAPLRPPCIDGVVISNGLLHWGQWMCTCNLSLYGHVCLGPAGELNSRPSAAEARLTLGRGDTATVKQFETKSDDWPTYCGDNARTCVSKMTLPGQVSQQWTFRALSATRPTAPVAAGGVVYQGDHTGALRALDAADGKLRWKAHTGGAIFSAPAVWQGRVYVGSADGRVYAFEAATGRPLWTFRVAPAQRWIPVYGKLISTWPVAGGVVVQNGVVYAAAGIAHYDGTHVVALNAVTGKLKWCNDSSGKLSRKTKSGISLQGYLCLRDGELRFSGGNVHETARYDLQTGKCLNSPHDHRGRYSFRTTFCPYYPRYGQYMCLNYTFPDGKTLNYDVGSRTPPHLPLTPLTLLVPTAPGTPELEKDETARLKRRTGAPKREVVWNDKSGRRFNSFVIAGDVLLAAGQTKHGAAFLAAINIKDGSDVWQKELPAPVVEGGTAVDQKGRIFVSLEDGRMLCFAAEH